MVREVSHGGKVEKVKKKDNVFVLWAAVVDEASFEVTVNGKLAYSKLEAGGFPDTKESRESHLEASKDVPLHQ
ncbi:unnamed protein product [Coregonus sp. 'balchen']|nr:unnamed protein product [Coregonus sp. 'balchen']